MCRDHTKQGHQFSQTYNTTKPAEWNKNPRLGSYYVSVWQNDQLRGNSAHTCFLTCLEIYLPFLKKKTNKVKCVMCKKMSVPAIIFYKTICWPWIFLYFQQFSSYRANEPQLYRLTLPMRAAGDVLSNTNFVGLIWILPVLIFKENNSNCWC